MRLILEIGTSIESELISNIESRLKVIVVLKSDESQSIESRLKVVVH